MACGLFIDKNNPFLGATPDGVIHEYRVVEIKCLMSEYKSTLEAERKKQQSIFTTARTIKYHIKEKVSDQNIIAIAFRLYIYCLNHEYRDIY